MGDLPKPPDDATWTEVERTFFDAAPPEMPPPVGEAPRLDDLPAPPPARPRRQIIARAAGGLVRRGWRGVGLVVAAVGARARAARASAAGLVAALWLWRVDRRQVAVAMVGAILAAGLSAAIVASRTAAPPRGATVERGAPLASSPLAEAASVATSPSPPDSPPRANVSDRRPHPHRRSLPASSSAPRPTMTAYVDRQTYWAHEARSAPSRSGRPFFSR